MAHSFADYDANGKLDMTMIGMNSWTAERVLSMNLQPPTHRHYFDRLDDLTFGNRLYFGGDQKFEQRPMGDRVANTGWSCDLVRCRQRRRHRPVHRQRTQEPRVSKGLRSPVGARHLPRQLPGQPAMEVYFRAPCRLPCRYSYGGYEKQTAAQPQNENLDEVAFLMNTSHEIDSRNVVSGDIDGDGRLDLIYSLFRLAGTGHAGPADGSQPWPGDNKWIGVNLSRSKNCPSLNGTRVHSGPTAATSGATSPTVTVPLPTRSDCPLGLGQADAVEEVEVHWPNGKSTKLAPRSG